MDVTVVSPLQATLVDRAATEAGHALQYALDRKNRQSAEDCHREGVKFLPLPIETLGRWHSQAICTIGKLAKQLAGHTWGLEAEVTSHLYQRLGILLMKGNAALIISRSPDFPPQELDGVVDS